MLAALRRNRFSPRVGVELREDGVAIAAIDPTAAGSLPVLKACEFIETRSEGERAQALLSSVRSHRLVGAPCVGVLSNGDYSLLQLEAPEVAPEELADAIRWRVKDLIAYPVEEAVVDVFEYPASSQRSHNRHVCAVTAPGATVQTLVDLLREAELSIDAIDVVEMAQRNTTLALPESEAGMALLTVGETRSLVTLIKAGALFLSRGVDVGREQLEIEAQGDGGDKHYRDTLVLELQRSLDYFVSFFSQPPISRVFVHPAQAEDPLLQDLREVLTLDFRPFDLGAIVRGEAPGPMDIDPRCLNAIGAAMREARQ